MARYSLVVLKVPLNTKQTNQNWWMDLVETVWYFGVQSPRGPSRRAGNVTCGDTVSVLRRPTCAYCCRLCLSLPHSCSSWWTICVLGHPVFLTTLRCLLPWQQYRYAATPTLNCREILAVYLRPAVRGGSIRKYLGARFPLPFPRDSGGRIKAPSGERRRRESTHWRRRVE